MAAGVVFVFLGLALLGALAPTLGMMAGGAMIAFVGLAVSVVGSIGYHLSLLRTLGARGVLPRRWWLDPTGQHVNLTRPERRQVMPWFLMGAAGFVVVILGAVVVFIAVLGARDPGPS
jgi:hypothetical protein